MGSTSIEWADRVWNPLRGCSRISPGCANCYAEVMAGRFAATWGSPEIVRPDGTWSGVVSLVEEKLAEPLSWHGPCRVFVDSQSDLFHQAVPDAWIDRIFAVMALRPHIDFLVLTKRPRRMQEYLSHTRGEGNVLYRIVKAAQAMAKPERGVLRGEFAHDMGWPIRNVWLGTSIENQKAADERIPILRRTWAAVRFLSVEPLLEQVDLCLTPGAEVSAREGAARGIHWVIAGHESRGPRPGRPGRVSWVRSIVDQCRDAAVPAFVKQLQVFKCRQCDTCFEEPQDGGHDGCGSDDPSHDVRRALSHEPQEWPEDLRVRECPVVAALGGSS